MHCGFDRSGTQLQGPLRIYGLTEFGGLISRGFWTVAKRGWGSSKAASGSTARTESVCLLAGKRIGMTSTGSLDIWCWRDDQSKWSCSGVFKGMELFPHLTLGPWSVRQLPGCQSAFSKLLTLVLDCTEVSQLPTWIPKLPQRHFYLLLMDAKLLFLMGEYEWRTAYLAIFLRSLCFLIWFSKHTIRICLQQTIW